MIRRFDPPGIAAPFSTYVHGVETPPGARWLHTAGQVGVRRDGSIGETLAEQAEQAWDNVLAILAGAGMGPEDVVKTTLYLSAEAAKDRDAVASIRAIRDRKLGATKAASTAVVVAALIRPEWLIEIEAVAAKLP